MFKLDKPALIEWLKDRQHEVCAYGTRDGDGRPCDCKYGGPAGERYHSEQNGCPEFRSAIRYLQETE